METHFINWRLASLVGAGMRGEAVNLPPKRNKERWDAKLDKTERRAEQEKKCRMSRSFHAVFTRHQIPPPTPGRPSCWRPFPWQRRASCRQPPRRMRLPCMQPSPEETKKLMFDVFQQKRGENRRKKPEKTAFWKNVSFYPLITLLVLGRGSLVLLLGVRVHDAPTTSQLLGGVSEGQAGVGGLHAGSLVGAEQEIRRPIISQGRNEKWRSKISNFWLSAWKNFLGKKLRECILYSTYRFRLGALTSFFFLPPSDLADATLPIVAWLGWLRARTCGDAEGNKINDKCWEDASEIWKR